jgi:hypothetical protein
VGSCSRGTSDAGAASSPSSVRALMMSRSDSANAARMWKNNRPSAVVVSMF